MHAYSTLREIILGVGGRLQEEHLRPDSFGSAYAVFVGHSCRFRLVWDGKEGCGFLQEEKTLDQWTSQGPFVRERFGGRLSDVTTFLATVERLIAGTEKS